MKRNHTKTFPETAGRTMAQQAHRGGWIRGSKAKNGIVRAHGSDDSPLFADSACRTSAYRSRNSAGHSTAANRSESRGGHDRPGQGSTRLADRFYKN